MVCHHTVNESRTAFSTHLGIQRVPRTILMPSLLGRRVRGWWRVDGRVGVAFGVVVGRIRRGCLFYLFVELSGKDYGLIIMVRKAEVGHKTYKI